MAPDKGKSVNAPAKRRVQKRRDDRAVTSEQMLANVRGQVEPAFVFAMSYLRMLSESLGLGALAVWFGSQGIEQYVVADSKEFDWRNELADLLRTTAPLGPEGLSPFCAALRRNAEGDRRCHECDARWIARARKTGRSWSYQCHAGLNEVVAPIVVNEKRVGEVMGGQLASSDTLPGGFEDVWRRVGDIEGLNKAELATAFATVHVVGNPELHQIRVSLQAAARALGALVESVSNLMSRETLLGQVRSHLERDFAWFALTQADASEEDIAARAKALGLTEKPSVAIVAQADPTSRISFSRTQPRVAANVPAMFEAAQRLLSGTPNSIASSIRPGELVILLSPERTRNPALRTLRIRELVAKLRDEIESRCSVPILVGVGGVEPGFVSLAKSYEEARTALGMNPSEPAPAKKANETLMGRMAALGRDLHSAIQEGDKARLEEHIENQLRLFAGRTSVSDEVRRCLFSQMVFDALAILRGGTDSAAADQIQARYAVASASLRSGADMAEWFHANVMPPIKARLEAPRSFSARRVRSAEIMVAQSLIGPPSREAVARAVGMSGVQFGKVFRKEAGMTYREFVRRTRINQAQRLLLVPGKTVTQIAQDVGYTTTAAFSRAFEQECGASPCAYRNNPEAFAPLSLPEGFGHKDKE